MPENEKPPAMRVDHYFLRKLTIRQLTKGAPNDTIFNEKSSFSATDGRNADDREGTENYWGRRAPRNADRLGTLELTSICRLRVRSFCFLKTIEQKNRSNGGVK